MKREAEFVTLAVRRFLDPATVLPDQTAIDWKVLLRLAEAHAVTPMVYKALRDISIPDAAEKQLRYTFERSVTWSLAQTAELVRMSRLLQQREIPVVALKGPLLSRYLYADFAARSSGDIDLLTTREHVVNIRETLLSRGYHVRSTPHWGSKSACLRSRENEMTFESPSGVSVDVHWRLIPPFFASPFDELDAWSGLRTVELAGCPIDTLGPESLFLFLCSHGAKHMFERVGWICDVARFLTVTPDLNWSRVMEYGRRASALRQILLSVRLAEGILGAPSPRDLPHDSRVNTMAQTIRERLLAGATPPATVRESTSYSLKLLETSGQRLRYLSGIYMTPSEAEYRAVRLPPALHFLYYPFRPVRLFWKHAILRGNNRA